MLTLTTNRTVTTGLMVLLSLSTACTTMRPAGVTGDSIQREIKSGDTVRVVTKGGPVHFFQVTVVGATSLGGNAVNPWSWSRAPDPVGAQIDVAYADIAELDVKRSSGLKTVGLVAAAVLVVVAIASGGGSHDVGYGNR